MYHLLSSLKIAYIISFTIIIIIIILIVSIIIIIIIIFKILSIGELAVLDPTQVSPISALSSTAVELYSFDVTTMQHVQCHLHAQTMSQLTESYSLHNPPHEKIAYYYR